MRIKTLSVVLIGAMALFTAFYWLTDASRREATYNAQLKELVAYGQELFGPPTATNLNTANCAKCHGADGMGGEVPNLGGRRAPNLHSKSIYEKLKAQAGGAWTEIRKPGDPPDYVNLVIRYGGGGGSRELHLPH